MSEFCEKLHMLIREGRRFDFNSMGDNEIPLNGIYVMFEKGESSHGGERIVRIGTHTGDKQLRSRIYQHFKNENKNRSIFRKNIGRCFLNKEKNPYLSVWEKDMTARKNKEKFGHLRNEGGETKIEERISRYIKKNLSFCVLDVPNKEDRLHFEARLIGTVSGCEKRFPSKNWLGHFSPVDKIKKNGLWQVNKLFSSPLNEQELLFVSKALVRKK